MVFVKWKAETQLSRTEGWLDNLNSCAHLKLRNSFLASVRVCFSL